MTKIRVIWGETCPTWHRDFDTDEAASTFAKGQRLRGYLVFYFGAASLDAPKGSVTALADWVERAKP